MIIKNQKEYIVEKIENDKNLTKKQKQEKISYLEELESVEEKYRGKLIRTTLMQLAKSDSKHFDITLQKILRKNCLIEVSEFVSVNWRHAESGRLYILDEHATDENITAHEKWKQENKEKQQLEEEVGAEVANTIKAIGQAAKNKVGRPAKKD